MTPRSATTPRRLALLGALSCALLPLTACETPEPTPQEPSPRTLRLLQTSDLHTNLFAWDYFTGKADPARGLAKVATLVQRAREAGTPNTVSVIPARAPAAPVNVRADDPCR